MQTETGTHALRDSNRKSDTDKSHLRFPGHIFQLGNDLRHVHALSLRLCGIRFGQNLLEGIEQILVRRLWQNFGAMHHDARPARLGPVVDFVVVLIPIVVVVVVVGISSAMTGLVVVVVVVGAVSPKGPVNPGAWKTPRNTGAPLLGASTRPTKGGAASGKGAAVGPP